MKKLLLLIAVVLTTSFMVAASKSNSPNIISSTTASQPKLVNQTFRNGETYLDFKSNGKVRYSYGEGDDMIVRDGTWSAKLLTERKNYNPHRFSWQISIKVPFTYGTKEMRGYIDTYEDGAIIGDMNIDGNTWTRL